ncbi:RDD family protein [Chryseobacterium sp. CFBP8996]|uniref:RDD family protein n=1 Tax=Chryseobacterium sp. CFBP8996 TaxID=3096529 RepID=UPI002A6AAFC3|nr:RDD family protein [Chryseobacterium sp. CFBP8996]MDY0931988.1 RDD family protein [Chryseobacterium sp. CFBP8996]
MKRISELKERKIIRRATRNFDSDGNRIYNEFEYEFPYNPIHKGNERERLYAKVIDLIPFFLIFHYGFNKIIIVSLFFSISCVLIYGTISESIFGTTLGKKLFKLKVIDDFGNYPKILKSMFRNILSFANFFPVFEDVASGPNSSYEASKTTMHFSMHMNNKLCKTYIVKESQIPEIRKLLNYKILN